MKRTNRHSNDGNFDGMDWILDDTGKLLKNSQPQNDDKAKDDQRRAPFGDDAEKTQNPDKKCRGASDAKGVGREKGSTPKGTLSNNNLKNYQQEELSKEIKENNDSAKAESIPYSEIIDYLNEKTSADYKANDKATQRLIKARFKKGYKLDDFIKVIDDRASAWRESPMWRFMRPKTLFGDNFDYYLNASKLEKNVGNRNIFGGNGFKTVEQETDWEHKDVDTQSDIPTETLREMFKNLKNK